MEESACAADAILGVAAHQLGSLECVVRFEPPAEVKWLNTHDDVQRVVAFDFEHAHPVATPCQRAEPHAARVLRLFATRSNRKPGVCLVAAEALGTPMGEPARLERRLWIGRAEGRGTGTHVYVT